MIRRPTRCTRTVTLFPSTTLCRARQAQFLALIEKGVAAQREQQHQRQPRQALRIAPLRPARDMARGIMVGKRPAWPAFARSEEHTSELQSLMRISYAVFCLKKKNNIRLPTSLHIHP